jgi:TrmH family RNA methyltransferase
MEPLEPSRRQITEWARLTQKKFRREREQFLIEGDVCVREALRAGLKIEALLALSSEAEAWQEEIGSRNRPPVYALNTDVFQRFCKVESSQGVVAVADVFSLPARRSKLAICCEQISDPGNCGALIRVADFFGASELFLGNDSAEIWNPRVIRGSMGSLFSQPVREDANLAEMIAQWPGSTVAAVAHGGQSLRGKLNFKSPVLLVLGHETRGLSENLTAICSHHVTLERGGDAESLNLVTAAAVFAFALTD